MAEPLPREVSHEFWDQLARAEQRVLLLDYDGTLAPFNADRFAAVPYPGVREALQRIQCAGHTRLIFISGRLLSELFALLQLDPRPEAWGSHGVEHYLPDGTYETSPVPEASQRCIAAACAWAEGAGYGERLEKKSSSVVFHWRGLPDSEAETLRAAVTTSLPPRIDQSLAIHEFDGGIELRLAAVHKGSAVDQVFAELGTSPAVAYLGDDLTDEDAFRALQERGLSVLVRPVPRATLADVWITPPEELLQFLQRWHEACMGG